MRADYCRNPAWQTTGTEYHWLSTLLNVDSKCYMTIYITMWISSILAITHLHLKQESPKGLSEAEIIKHKMYNFSACSSLSFSIVLQPRMVQARYFHDIKIWSRVGVMSRSIICFHAQPIQADILLMYSVVVSWFLQPEVQKEWNWYEHMLYWLKPPFIQIFHFRFLVPFWILTSSSHK